LLERLGSNPQHLLLFHLFWKAGANKLWFSHVINFVGVHQIFHSISSQTFGSKGSHILFFLTPFQQSWNLLWFSSGSTGFSNWYVESGLLQHGKEKNVQQSYPLPSAHGSQHRCPKQTWDNGTWALHHL
jgi:hypothetical protein